MSWTVAAGRSSVGVVFSYLSGLGLGFSLIVAIGAQNLFVLRQGLRRERVLLTAAICAVSDAVLIVLGVSGIGLVLQAVPWLFDAVRWAGAAFLIGYGVLAARRAWRGEGEALRAASEPGRGAASEPDPRVASGRAPSGRAASGGVAVATTATAARTTPVVLTALALTWLNPHVYLDTVFLLGTVANAQGDGRWVFAAGAATASLVWFFGLAFGARLLSGVLATSRAWRIFDAVIAAVMIALGVGLAVAH